MMYRVYEMDRACYFWHRPMLFGDVHFLFRDKTSRNDEKRCQECIISPRKCTGNLSHDVPQCVNGTGGAIDTTTTRARDFRASSRLTSSRTDKIYEKNACQRGMKFMKTLVFRPGRLRQRLSSRPVAALAASFLSGMLLPPYFSSIHFPRAKLGARL